MNKENAAQFLPLVQAMAEGKTIQFLNGGTSWIEKDEIMFNLDPASYRIKPEPRTFWIVINHLKNLTVYQSPPRLTGAAQSIAEIIEVKEVL